MWERVSRVLNLGVDVILEYEILREEEEEKIRLRLDKLGVDLKIYNAEK